MGDAQSATTMSAPLARGDERLGLVIALVLHAGVIAALLFQPVRDEVLDIPERVTVSLASDVSLEATSPNPTDESQAAFAPSLDQELGETPEEVPTEVAPETTPSPTTSERALTSPRPQPTRSNTPPRPRATQAPAPRQGGGSRLNDSFLEGMGDSTESEQAQAPAPTFGRRERAALSSAITRQLRPHWTAPQGVDVELLVSVVAFDLNLDGSLNGRPRVISQRGINASNRAQAALHGERAIRAVQLAAPFNLPEQFYSRWDELEWEFDRRL